MRVETESSADFSKDILDYRGIVQVKKDSVMCYVGQKGEEEKVGADRAWQRAVRGCSRYSR